jgi:hypothetical protein
VRSDSEEIDMPEWIFTIPPSSHRLPYAHYGYGISPIQGSDVDGTTAFLPQTSPADIVMLMTRVTSRRLDGMHLVPNHGRTPLIDDVLLAILKPFAGDEMQYMPVTIRTKDGEVTRFGFARPLVRVPCLDLDKSDIVDWIVPGERILDARHLVFRPNCLGARHYVRESYTGRVVVSDALKDAWMTSGDKGLNFSRPEDLWNIYRDIGR